MTQPSWFNTPSGTMRAAVLTSPGARAPEECFTIENTYPKPTLPSQEWVLVRVYAAGLNRAELRSRNGDKPGLPEFGLFQSEYHEDPPKILGEEFVGEVELAGSDTDFNPGEKVAGWVYGGGKPFDGSYAEYTICPKQRCWKIQTTLPWEVVGAIPMSMWTAYSSIFVAGETKKGDTVLVHGATSSVGIWAVLLAKDAGCTVIATTRQPSKVERLKTAGAGHVLLEEGIFDSLKKLAPNGVNTILELVGPDKLVEFSLPNLARHGTVVTTGILTKEWKMGSFSPALIPPTRKITMATTEDEDIELAGKVLQDAIAKVENGAFRKEIFLDRVFKLEEVGSAHAYMEENRAVGKVVVRI